MLGDYVTLDAGTGAVHTAPGHGADDFQTGMRYGLEIYAPIGPAGHFLDTVELFGGLRVFDANPEGRRSAQGARPAVAPRVVLASVPALLALPQPGDLPRDVAVVHLDGRRLPVELGRRQDAARGRARSDRSQGDVDSVVGPRSDLQHGREPARLVHLAPAGLGRADSGAGLHRVRRGDHVAGASSTQAAAVFEQYGADTWYERPTDDFVPPGLTCTSCGGTDFEREMNILDVWFDSGSSHEAVLSVRPELTWPADMYLEGSDQHRGWFQSSLLVGLGTRGRAPFSEVLTHGFLIDLEGVKMSKSLGNSIEAEQVVKQSGADILRLWVVDERLPRRDPRQQRDSGARGRGLPEDPQHAALSRVESVRLRPADGRGADRAARGSRSLHSGALRRRGADAILRAYESYDYGTIFQTLNAFVTVDLSAFYADVSKDRLYTFARAIARTPLGADRHVLMADGLTRLLAPILSFTADELWRYLPGGRRRPSTSRVSRPRTARRRCAMPRFWSGGTG